MPVAEALTNGSAGTLKLGNDIEVRRLGYGAMRITGKGVCGEPEESQEAVAVLGRLPELGVNLIDTADSYGPHVSEELIAGVLHPYRGMTIATKGGLERTGPGEWLRNGHPNHLKQACEGSLSRLRVDRIDLYQLHSPDDEIPYEESVGAMKELQEEGKIRHVGISNVSIEQLEQAREIVDVVSVQNRFNLEDRGSEDVLDRCEELGICFFPWFPLAAGSLAKPGGVAAEIAEAHGATTGQVALAWLLQRSPVTVLIPGTASLAHLEENVAAANIALSEEEIEQLSGAGD
jgi:pyridoxine 4-dehydrogenase